MDGIEKKINGIGAHADTLNFNQRAILAAVVVISVLSVAAFLVWLGQGERAVLFTGLSAGDTAFALEELAGQNVEAELTDGGNTILVPAEDVHRLRADLATKGLPSSGTVGLDISGRDRFGPHGSFPDTDDKRTLEGELTRAIETLQGVQSARVHLVLPGPDVRAPRAAEATASVVLRLGRTARPAESQIAGIRSLVAGSLENLDPANVTVIDHHGRVLSRSSREGAPGRSGGQLALRKDIEAHLEEKAGSMLDRVLGPGRSIVRIDATLNYEKIETEREFYDPAAAAVRSETRAESGDPATGSTSEESETSYEVNRTIERIVGESGGVEGLSVAVFVDGRYEVGEDGGMPVYTPLGADDMEQLRRIVRTAVGLDAVRGDRIEIVNMPFRQTGESLTYGTGAPVPAWIDLVGRYGGRAAVLIMLGAVALVLRHNIRRMLEDSRSTDTSPRSTAAALDGKSGDPGELPDMDPQVIQDLQALAVNDPERVAQVIESWIDDFEVPGRAREAVGD